MSTPKKVTPAGNAGRRQSAVPGETDARERDLALRPESPRAGQAAHAARGARELLAPAAHPADVGPGPPRHQGPAADQGSPDHPLRPAAATAEQRPAAAACDDPAAQPGRAARPAHAGIALPATPLPRGRARPPPQAALMPRGPRAAAPEARRPPRSGRPSRRAAERPGPHRPRRHEHRDGRRGGADLPPRRADDAQRRAGRRHHQQLHPVRERHQRAGRLDLQPGPGPRGRPRAAQLGAVRAGHGLDHRAARSGSPDLHLVEPDAGVSCPAATGFAQADEERAGPEEPVLDGAPRRHAGPAAGRAERHGKRRRRGGDLHRHGRHPAERGLPHVRLRPVHLHRHGEPGQHLPALVAGHVDQYAPGGGRSAPRST